MLEGEDWVQVFMGSQNSDFWDSAAVDEKAVHYPRCRAVLAVLSESNWDFGSAKNAALQLVVGKCSKY